MSRELIIIQQNSDGLYACEVSTEGNCYSIDIYMLFINFYLSITAFATRKNEKLMKIYGKFVIYMYIRKYICLLSYNETFSVIIHQKELILVLCFFSLLLVFRLFHSNSVATRDVNDRWRPWLLPNQWATQFCVHLRQRLACFATQLVH